MKVDLLKLVKKSLENERVILNKAIDSAKKARDSAPSATESHYDTDRNQNEKMVAALEEELLQLDHLIQNLPISIPDDCGRTNLWSYIELPKENQVLKIIIVPEGYGGRDIDGIKLVSISAPLAKKILDRVKRG